MCGDGPRFMKAEKDIATPTRQYLTEGGDGTIDGHNSNCLVNRQVQNQDLSRVQ